jgi:hypothetical protein
MLAHDLRKVRARADLLFGVVSRGDPRHPARKSTRNKRKNGAAALLKPGLARRGRGKRRASALCLNLGGRP